MKSNEATMDCVMETLNNFLEENRAYFWTKFFEKTLNDNKKCEVE